MNNNSFCSFVHPLYRWGIVTVGVTQSRMSSSWFVSSWTEDTSQSDLTSLYVSQTWAAELEMFLLKTQLFKFYNNLWLRPNHADEELPVMVFQWCSLHAKLGVLSCLTTRQGPRQSHEEIPEVIGMANKTPPAGHQQTFARCCGDGLQSCKEPCRMKSQIQFSSIFNCRSPSTGTWYMMCESTSQSEGGNALSLTYSWDALWEMYEYKWLTCNTWMCGIPPELILLWVGLSENIISNSWQQGE